jgi:hypothetical protein
MFRLDKWLRRSSPASRRSARGPCPSRLEVERLDDLILLSHAAVINYQVGTVTHENVFITGSDGNLHLDYWDGAWHWVNLGNGGSGGVFETPAAINYQVGGVTHENVFATGNDGNLHLDYWDGSAWHWVNLGNDGGIPVYSTPAAINYQVGGVTHENVFVTGNDGNLHLDYWDGSAWHWVNLGNGGSSLASHDPAAINYQVGTVTHENVFVAGNDGKLYLDYWDGSAWHWANLGNDGNGLFETPAVINYQVGSVTHENVFVPGSDGNLYLDFWNGSAWHWVNLGNGGSILHAEGAFSPGQPDGAARPQPFQERQAPGLPPAHLAGGSGGALPAFTDLKASDLVFAASSRKGQFLEPSGLLSAAEFALLGGDLADEL